MEIDKLLLESLVLILSIILHILIHRKISNAQIKKSFKTIIIIVCSSLILTLNNYQINPVLKLVCNFIAMNIIYLFALNIKFKQSMVVGLIIFFMGIINDLLISVILSFFGVNTMKILFKESYLIVYLLTVLNPVISLLMLKINRIKKFFQKILMLRISDRLKSVCYIIFLMCMVSIMILNLKFVDNIVARHYIVIILAIFVGLIVSILSLYYSKNMIAVENKKYKQMNSDYAMVSKNYKLLRHNLVNRLLSLKSVSNKKTIALINEMINEYKLEEHQVDIFNAIPKGIKGIIYQKIYVHDASHINFNIDCSVGREAFSSVDAKKYNALCELLGLALDNAIESAIESNDKILYIDIYKEEKNIIIKIVNSYNNIIDINLIGTNNYTTKENGNGIGLNYIIKNRIIKSSIKVQDGFFTVALKI